MKKLVNDYINENYNELREIAFKLTQNHSLTEDLLHFCLLEILEKPDIKFNNNNDNSIKYYIIAVMRINFYSKTSRFYYQVRREFEKYQELPIFLHQVEETQYNFEMDEMIACAEDSFCSLSWFHKSLWEMYMTYNSINKVSKHTTIPLSNVSKYINKIKADMRKQILKELENKSKSNG